MGGFLAGGEKYWGLAEGVNVANQNLSQEIAFAQGNRQLLQQIRQARLAAANTDYYEDNTTGEYIQTSGAPAATANIYSTFGGAYSYSVDQSLRLERLKAGQLLAGHLTSKAAKADKRAATNAKIMSAGLQTAGAVAGAIVGGMIGGPAGAAAGAKIGQDLGQATSELAVRGLKGGKAARKAVRQESIKLGMQRMSEFADNTVKDLSSREDMSEYNLEKVDPLSEDYAKTVGKRPVRQVSQNSYINKLNAAKDSAGTSQGGFFSQLLSFGGGN